MGLGPLFLITPLVGWTWPSLVPVALAVGAGLGYKKLSETGEKGWLRGRVTWEMENLRRVEIPLEDFVKDLIAEEVARDERLVLAKDDCRLVLRCDARGRFFVEMLGPRGRTAASLRREGEAFARSLVQDFVYNRVMREMEQRGMNVVSEGVEEESGDLILNLRKWR